MTVQRKYLALLAIVIALLLLYPGVTKPVLTLSGTIEKSQIAEMGITMLAGENADTQTRQLLSGISSFLGLDQLDGQLEVYSNTRSIWQTAEALARSGNVLVAILVVFFSMVVPVCKLLLQAASLLLEAGAARSAALWLNGALSKWSMADVFVMGLLIAYMAGSASEQMGDMLTMHAYLEVGFFYFLAYCLFSIAASSLFKVDEGSAVQSRL